MLQCWGSCMYKYLICSTISPALYKMLDLQIISAISLRLHQCLGSPTVENTHSKRRQDTQAQISRLGWYWERRGKIQEFFLFAISQHYNDNLLPPARGPTLYSRQSLTYIFYAWVGSHDIQSPLREDSTSNVTTDDCDKRWPDLIVGVQAQAGPQLLAQLVIIFIVSL